MTQLELNCLGHNTINDLTKQALKKVLPQLEKYIGKQIVLSNGELSKRFKIEKLEKKNYRSSIRVRYGSVTLWNDICIMDEPDSNGYSVCSYYKRAVHIGKVKDGILTEVYTDSHDSEFINKKYSAKKQQALQTKIDKLQDELYQLKKQQLPKD
jgi:hypothetical protein